MSEQEVIQRLKEHLKFYNNKYNRIPKKCRGECIKMIMDFLPDMTKAEATQLFEDKILYIKTVPSQYDSNILYHKYISGIVVELKKPLMLDNSSISLFADELKAVGGIA